MAGREDGARVGARPGPHAAPPSTGTIGTITNALSSLWGWGGGTVTSSSSSTPTHSNNVPGGWATGYFSRKASVASIADDGDDHRNPDTPPAASSDLPQIKVRSASANRLKRTAIPFERTATPTPTHSRGNSQQHIVNDIASPAAITTPTTTAASSATSSPRRMPTRNLGSDSAMATLSRLKAQSSMSSLKSNSFDNSFATVPDGGGSDAASDAASASSSSMISSPTASPTSRRPPASHAALHASTLARTQLLDDYVHDIVYQSGIDGDGRPIVLLSSPALPDPRQVDYDALLTRIMDHMELFVQNDYTVVFFAGGSSHRPPWTWIWKSYRRLSRPFRKNCRRLYICHPTFFTRTLVQLVSTGSALLSPKFARKITTVYTLSDLAHHVDLTQIDVPAAVLKWNAKYEREVKIPGVADDAAKSSLPHHPPTAMFGVSITSLMGQRGESGSLPRVLKDCVEELQQRHMDVEGIFRKSPSAVLLQAAKQAYDRGAPVSLKQYDDPNIAASLIKLFFRSLPDPIFPAAMYPVIRACPRGGDGGNGSDDNANNADAAAAAPSLSYIRSTLLPAIDPPSKLIVLAYVLELLHKISRRSALNKMDATNLATVMCPNFVSSHDPMRDMAICAVVGAPSMSSGAATRSEVVTARPTTLGTIIKTCIEHYYEVFEFDYIDYEPPTYHDAVDASAAASAAAAGMTAVATPPAMSSPRSGRFASPSSPRSVSTSIRTPATTAATATRSPLASRGGGSRSVHSATGVGTGIGHGTPSSLAAVRGLGSATTTVGRSASGSLRLTKARLGSASGGGGASAASGASGAAGSAGSGGGGADSAFAGASSAISASSAANGSRLTLAAGGGGGGGLLFGGSSAGDTASTSSSSLATTGTTSGVALTGANALGFFTTGYGAGAKGGQDDDDAGDALRASTLAASISRSASRSRSHSQSRPLPSRSRSSSGASSSLQAPATEAHGAMRRNSSSGSVLDAVVADGQQAPDGGADTDTSEIGAHHDRSPGALKSAAAAAAAPTAATTGGGGGATGAGHAAGVTGRPLSELKEEEDGE